MNPIFFGIFFVVFAFGGYNLKKMFKIQLFPGDNILAKTIKTKVLGLQVKSNKEINENRTSLKVDKIQRLEKTEDDLKMKKF